MRVIAVDPGYDRCGIAILDGDATAQHVVYSTCVTSDRNSAFSDRLWSVGSAFADLIKKHNPSECAIERVYFNTNQKTALYVSEVRGVLVYIAREHGITVHEYTPAQIKSSVAGWGKADKNQVTSMVQRLLRLPPEKRVDDEYDALAAGITHLAHRRAPTAKHLVK